MEGNDMLMAIRKEIEQNNAIADLVLDFENRNDELTKYVFLKRVLVTRCATRRNA